MRLYFHDFLIFIYRQAYACIFGFFLVFMIVLTKYSYPLEGIIYRYDFLFLAAITFQIFLIVTRLESWREVGVIAIFHIVAMVMEIFKTHPSIGSWSYPGVFTLGIMHVPFFAGFMYSAVGSYIARVWRIFEFRFENYPKRLSTVLIALAIYINFFTHHFIWDMRYIIFCCILFIYGRTRVYFKPGKVYYSMNLILGFSLVAFVIWITENIGTFTRTWIYPSNVYGGFMVNPQKIGAWFLLMIISFVLVSLIHPPRKYTDHSKIQKI